MEKYTSHIILLLGLFLMILRISAEEDIKNKS